MPLISAARMAVIYCNVLAVAGLHKYYQGGAQSSPLGGKLHDALRHDKVSCVQITTLGVQSSLT